jgi:two-component system, OmpR family, response regulator
MTKKVGDARHIVVVDGNRFERATLVEYLRKHGFLASGIATLQTHACEPCAVDLIILDLMTSSTSGLAECARIREELGLPLIAMSQQAEDVDRILALESGADDFVAKPFNPREVLARVRNVLRRAEATLHPVTGRAGRYSFAGWTLDGTARCLIGANGELVPLAGGEFELLFALVSNANRVLSRDELLDLTTGRDAQAFDRSIDVKISRLRQRIGDHAHHSRIIKAIYGKGYVLAAPVAVAD